jgi:hypothetical protein
MTPRPLIAIAAAALALAGCQSVDSIRALPPADELAAAAPYRTVATCIADLWMRRIHVVLIDREAEQRATVTQFMDNGFVRQPLTELEVVATGPQTSVARVRLHGSIWGPARAPVGFFRDAMAACGHAG